MPGSMTQGHRIRLPAVYGRRSSSSPSQNPLACTKGEEPSVAVDERSKAARAGGGQLGSAVRPRHAGGGGHIASAGPKRQLACMVCAQTRTERYQGAELACAARQQGHPHSTQTLSKDGGAAGKEP